MELIATEQRGMEVGSDIDLKEQEKDLEAQLEARERQEEVFWKQKSYVKW